jgi:ATP-dependent Lon protease
VDDIYKVGTVGSIIQLLRLPDGTVKVLIEGKTRVEVKKFLEEESFYKVEVEYMEEDLIDDSRGSSFDPLGKNHL